MLPQTFTKDIAVRIGVLLAPPPVQLLDLACIDIFHMLSKEYIGELELLPQAIKDLAIDKVEIFYIADKEDQNVTKLAHTKHEDQQSHPNPNATANDYDPRLVPLTANMTIQVTADLTNPSVQPGNLTILLIPGPDPSSTTPQPYKTFIQSHASCGITDIITICTGIIPACSSGICDNKVVTAPRGLLPMLNKKFKNVKSFEDKRWSRDYLNSSAETKGSAGSKDKRQAELWTSAGITNGHDVTAAYIREHFNHELGEIVLRMADVGDRPRDYDVGRVADGMWWMSTILSAVMKRLWRKS